MFIVCPVMIKKSVHLITRNVSAVRRSDFTATERGPSPVQKEGVKVM